MSPFLLHTIREQPSLRLPVQEHLSPVEREERCCHLTVQQLVSFTLSSPIYLPRLHTHFLSFKCVKMGTLLLKGCLSSISFHLCKAEKCINPAHISV